MWAGIASKENQTWRVFLFLCMRLCTTCDVGFCWSLAVRCTKPVNVCMHAFMNMIACVQQLDGQMSSISPCAVNVWWPTQGLMMQCIWAMFSLFLLFVLFLFLISQIIYQDCVTALLICYCLKQQIWVVGQE